MDKLGIAIEIYKALGMDFNKKEIDFQPIFDLSVGRKIGLVYLLKVLKEKV